MLAFKNVKKAFLPAFNSKKLKANDKLLLVYLRRIFVIEPLSPESTTQLKPALNFNPHFTNA